MKKTKIYDNDKLLYELGIIVLVILSIIAFIGHPYGMDWYLWGITSFDSYAFYKIYGLVAMVIFFIISLKELNSRGWFEFWFLSAFIVQPFFQFDFLVTSYGVLESIIYLIWAILLLVTVSKSYKLKK